MNSSIERYRPFVLPMAEEEFMSSRLGDISNVCPWITTSSAFMGSTTLYYFHNKTNDGTLLPSHRTNAVVLLQLSFLFSFFFPDVVADCNDALLELMPPVRCRQIRVLYYLMYIYPNFWKISHNITIFGEIKNYSLKRRYWWSLCYIRWWKIQCQDMAPLLDNT